MPLYDRQDELGLSRPYVAIVGCGGVGVWAALAICMGGAQRLELWDGDELSDNNLNRLPYAASSIGQPKSLVLANWLSSLRPDCDISARGKFEPKLGHSLEHVNWVVCATDSLKSRLMIHQLANEAGTQYIEVGADGERWTLGNQPPQFSTSLELEPGYTSVPVHIGPCMMAGAACAYYVLHNIAPSGDQLAEWDRGHDRLHMQSYWPLEPLEPAEPAAEYQCPDCGYYGEGEHDPDCPMFVPDVS